MTVRTRVRKTINAVAATVITGAVAIVATGCGSASSGGGTGPLRVEVSPGAITMMLDYVADDAGFFKKNGLNVRLVSIPAAPAAMSALAAGSVDVIASSPEVPLTSVSKGIKMQVVSGQSNVIWELVVNNHVKTTASYPASLSALKGKKLGVVQLGTPGQYLTEAILKDAGISPSDVTFVASGPPQETIAELGHNQIQGTLVNEPTPTAVKLQHTGRVLVDLRSGKVGPKALAGKSEVMEWAETSFIASHPTQIAKFRKSLAQADVWMHDPANFSKVEAIYAKVIGSAIPSSDMSAFIHENLPTATAAASESAMTAWIAFCKQYGIIPKTIPASSVFASGVAQTPAEVRQLAGG